MPRGAHNWLALHPPIQLRKVCHCSGANTSFADDPFLTTPDHEHYLSLARSRHIDLLATTIITGFVVVLSSYVH